MKKNHNLKTKKKLIVQLSGGIGNQMFQYACARSLALRNNVELILDNWSGFVRDFQYRRHYELGALPIKARVAKASERWPIWLNRLHHRLGHPISDLKERFWYGEFINETKFEWLPKLQRIEIIRNTYITGYWQSPLYFNDHTTQIQTELMPPPARQTIFLKIAELIRSCESVALGVRLYEESKNPNAHARDGRIKSAADVRGAVTRLLAIRPNARIFVFCSHRSPFLKELSLPQDVLFITPDDGYIDALESLWLLSQCRHHIFTNSSYFWWGAWLSTLARGEESQIVFAADNFYNKNSLLDEWGKF